MYYLNADSVCLTFVNLQDEAVRNVPMFETVDSRTTLHT
jgi:hypothetical protein